MNILPKDVAFADRIASGEWTATPGSEDFEVNSGSRVSVGEEDDRWSGWVRCTTNGGVSAWVHQSFLNLSGDSATLSEPYSARELSVRPGDPVTVLREVGGWSWVRKESGREGWVPDEVLRVPPARCRPY